MWLWVILSANLCSEGFLLAPQLTSFAQRSDADHYLGLCSVLEQSAACMRKDVGHWQTTVSAFFFIEDTLQRIYVVWILMSIIGLLGTFLGWTDSHFGGTFPFLVPERKPKCNFWMSGAG